MAATVRLVEGCVRVELGIDRVACVGVNGGHGPDDYVSGDYMRKVEAAPWPAGADPGDAPAPEAATQVLPEAREPSDYPSVHAAMYAGRAGDAN